MGRTPAHRKHRRRRQRSRVTSTGAGAAPEFGDVVREVFSLAVVASPWAGGVAPLRRLRVPRSSGPPSGGVSGRPVTETGAPSDGTAYLREVLGALGPRELPLPGAAGPGRRAADDVCATTRVG
jgi:hypothetical protein